MAEAASVRLRTSAELPSVEIVVLDHNFQFVHRGVGSIDVALAPGAYTVQFRAGAAVKDVAVSLRPDSGEVTLSAPELQLKSPAPLTGNDAGTLYGELTHAASREVHARPGRGAELMLFVRMAGADAAQAASSTERLFDVSVLDAQGRALAHLRDAPRRAEGDRARAYTIELDPGTYFLRFAAGSQGPLEQSCVLSEGWQTQVFASSRRYGSDTALGPNFPEAAVFMMPQGRGFDAQEARIAWSESARQSLGQGGAMAPERQLREAMAEARRIRATAPGQRVREMLRQEFANPMLGVYGLHMLLQSPQRDWELLRELVTNLELLIGAHPDVTALTLLPELQDLAAGERYAAPPMLRTSWSLIVAKTAQVPELVPRRSYAERVAERMWGAGAWLVWRAPGEEDVAGEAEESATGDADDTPTASAEEFDAAIAALRQFVTQRLQAGGTGGLIAELARDARFDATERALLLHLAATADRSARFLEALRAESPRIDRVLDFVRDKLADGGLVERARVFLERELGLGASSRGERLVRALGVPAASLQRAVLSLARKVLQKAP